VRPSQLVAVELVRRSPDAALGTLHHPSQVRRLVHRGLRAARPDGSLVWSGSAASPRSTSEARAQQSDGAFMWAALLLHDRHTGTRHDDSSDHLSAAGVSADAASTTASTSVVCTVENGGLHYLRRAWTKFVHRKLL
jgi:hypothetical protein